MTRTLLIALLFLTILSQISGCHFYVDAVPRVIVSSEQFALPTPPDNSHPNPPDTTETPNNDR